MRGRRDFLKLSVGICAAPAFAAAFAGCSSASDYIDLLNNTWAQENTYTSGWQDDAKKIIRYTTLAPSVRNTQPWQFRIYNDNIRLFADYSRRLRVADPDDRELLISIGCALENLVLASQYFGYDPKVDYFPEGSYPEYIDIKMKRSAKEPDTGIFNSIRLRHTNRGLFDKPRVPAEFLKIIEDLSLEPSVCCLVMTDQSIIKDILPLVRQANKSQIDNLPFMEEYVGWMRFDDEQAARHMDGLVYNSLGMPSSPSWLAGFLLKNFKSSKSQSVIDEKNIKSSSAIIALFSDKDKKKDRILTGRSLERILLTLTSMNIQYDFINQLCQVESTRSKLCSLLQSGSWQPQILIRAGFAPDMTLSPRRPVSQVLF